MSYSWHHDERSRKGNSSKPFHVSLHGAWVAYDGLGQVSWAIVGTLTATPATATWGSSDISHLLGSATCLNAGPRLEIQDYLRRTKVPFSLSAQMAFGNAGPPNFTGLSSDVVYPSDSAISSDSGRALPGIAYLKPPKGFYGVKDSEGFSKPSRTLYARYNSTPMQRRAKFVPYKYVP
jgi:hypothetical protein